MALSVSIRDAAHHLAFDALITLDRAARCDSRSLPPNFYYHF